MILAEARNLKASETFFLQENQTEHSELRDFMGGMSRVIEKMSFSARSKQTSVTDYFSSELASGGSANIGDPTL